MINELENTINKLDNHFRDQNPEMTEKERLFSRTVKLNEEIGELCEAILYENDKNQRDKNKDIDLDSELADVLICTMLLAHNREKSIWDEVNKKLTKQMNRFNLN